MFGHRSDGKFATRVFTSNGSYISPQAYVNGLVPAVWVGVGVLAVGALIAALVPFSTRAAAESLAIEEGHALMSGVAA
jgi:hypothetical protein